MSVLHLFSFGRLFHHYSLPEEFFDEETGGDARGHPEQVRLFVGTAQEVAEEVLYNIQRFEPVGQVRHFPPHVLFIHIVLVFQIPDRFS